jgi:integrase/recombinase XerD
VEQVTSEPQTIEHQIAMRAISQATTWRTRAYLELGYFAGLRVNEIAKVHSDDIDLQTETLTVKGKGGAEAVLPMHPLIARLALHKEGYWFPADTSRRHVQPTSVSQTIKTALLRAGSPTSATARALRHAYIARLFDATSNPDVVQQLARRTLPNTTKSQPDLDLEAMRDTVHRLGED